MDLQETAKKLLKMADQIEKDASDKTVFICSHCNHTASLTEINQRRTKLAGDQFSVKPVTINDKVYCGAPGCDGKMAYVATDSSDKFYVEEKAAAGDESMGGADPLLGDDGAVEETPPEPKKEPKKEPEKDPLLEAPKEEAKTGRRYW